jgi:hypothetical protein
MDLKLASDLAWFCKTEKGGNTADVPMEFCFVHGALAAAYEAWGKGGDTAACLAEATVRLMGLARMCRADLDSAVEAWLAAAVTAGRVPPP